jgi:hypothetical protein
MILLECILGQGVDWIHLTQNRNQCRALLNTVTSLRIPLKTMNFLSSWVIISFWRRTLLHGISQSVSRLVNINYTNMAVVGTSEVGAALVLLDH